MLVYSVSLSRFVLILKYSILLISFGFLSGCATIQNNRVLHTNGVYIQKGFSHAGVESVIYQFVEGNRLYTTRQKNSSDADVLAWVNNPNRNAWEYTYQNGKIKVNTHINDFSRVKARKYLENGSALAGSKFYRFTENGLKFALTLDSKSINTVTDIYSREGKHLLTGELQKFYTAGNDLFILKYADHSVLYDAEQNKALLRAQFITELKGTNTLFMVYQNDKFGVVDRQGITVMPFVYNDMMYLGKQLIGLQQNEQWSIKNLQNNQQISLNEGEIPVGKLLADDILPVLHQKNIKFYSLQSKKPLKLLAKRYARVPYFAGLHGSSTSNTYFRVAKKVDQWLLLRSNGSVALPMYVSAAYHIDNYLLATDLKGVSTVFDQYGTPYSKPVAGYLSPIYMEDYARKSPTPQTVLLKIKNKGKEGIADMKGNVLLGARFKKITYIGNNQFLLDEGQKGTNLKVYTIHKGLMTLPVSSATYLNGDTVIAQNHDKKYGLWSLKQADWKLPPKDYSFIKKGNTSRYLLYQQSKGIKKGVGVLEQNGSIIIPAQMKGDISLYKDYLYQKEKGIFTVYHLPDLAILTRVEGDSMTIEHDKYFVVKREKK